MFLLLDGSGPRPRPDPAEQDSGAWACERVHQNDWSGSRNGSESGLVLVAIGFVSCGLSNGSKVKSKSP